VLEILSIPHAFLAPPWKVYIHSFIHLSSWAVKKTSLWIFSFSWMRVWSVKLLHCGQNRYEPLLIILSPNTFVCADYFETPVSYAKYLRDSQWECSSLPLISSSFTSFSTQHFNSGVLPSNDTACLNLQLYVCGTVTPDIYAGTFSLLFLQNNFSHRYCTWTFIPVCFSCAISTWDITWLNECFSHRSRTVAGVNMVWGLGHTSGWASNT
jgi:hypothetical protein